MASYDDVQVCFTSHLITGNKSWTFSKAALPFSGQMTTRAYVLIFFFWAVLTIVTPTLILLSESSKPDLHQNGKKLDLALYKVLLFFRFFVSCLQDFLWCIAGKVGEGINTRKMMAYLEKRPRNPATQRKLSKESHVAPAPAPALALEPARKLRSSLKIKKRD